jgi:hypothetical protein
LVLVFMRILFSLERRKPPQEVPVRAIWAA